MKLGKRMVVFALSMLMILGLCACGGEAGVGADGSGASGENAVLKTYTEKYYEGNDDIVGIITQEYDKDGRLILDRYEDSAGNIKSENKYEYRETDDDNVVIKVAIVGGEESKGYEEIEYDDDGRVIHSKVYNIDGTLIVATENKYEDDGSREEKTIFYNMEVGGATPYSTIVYDQYGHVVSIKNIQYDSNEDGSVSEYISESKYEYEYDEDGRIIECICKTGNLENEIIYEYDTKGNIIKQQDGLITIEYEYDKYGNKILSKQYRDEVLWLITEYEYY